MKRFGNRSIVFQYFKRLIVGLMIIGYCVAPAYSQPQTNDHEEIKPLFVMISARLGDVDGIGAGLIFGFRPGRLYIATANHVVRRGITEAENIRVQFKSLPGEEWEAELLPNTESNLDLAVLKITDWENIPIDISDIPFNRLGDSDELEGGKEVYHIGYPNGQRWQTNHTTPENISSVERDLLKYNSYLIATGHSGGGLFNECWQLVGMITEDQQPEGVALRIEKILETLRQWGYPINLTPSRRTCDGGKKGNNNGVPPIGIRIGATSHYQPQLFIGKVSSPYIELFATWEMINLGFGGLSLGVEPSIGLDMVRNIGFFKGVIAANGFVNLLIAYSGLENNRMPIKISAGVGIGGQGISFAYSPNDPGYTDSTNSFVNGVIEFATNLFIEVEFPITEKIRLHGLLRRISESPKEITTFNHIPLNVPDPPQGRLGGYYFVGGISYRLR